jgi:hypothetical protein
MATTAMAGLRTKRIRLEPGLESSPASHRHWWHRRPLPEAEGHAAQDHERLMAKVEPADAIVNHHTALIVGNLLRKTGKRVPW